MKVVNNRKPTKVLFKNIPQGDCFFDNDGDIYLKIDQYDTGNAARLTNGAVIWVDNEEKVLPAKAEIVIYD